MMAALAADPAKFMAVYEKRCATNLTRHGHENPLAVGKVSKQSQDLFCKIYSVIGDGRFHGAGGELRIGTFYVDFALGNKVIEYNGDYWHANPALHEEKTVIKFRHKIMTAESIWERDAKRLDFIKAKGYEVKVVWEADFKKNPEQTVQDCLSWLTESK